MSSLYNLEPQPTAKVILQTTSGDLSLELFAKQAPLASRNFLQHCLDGYYNGTIFHRLVAGFIVQGGDPTGTGSGGASALDDGAPFEDEFHSRLKFNRRGLLGMANEGKDGNESQFFLTLGATPELQGRNTMFGRIEGDTIYNLMKIAEAELVEQEGSERPLYPTAVTGAEILVNPFEDMVARVKEAPRTKEDGVRKEVKKRKKPVGKNVLSFAGEGDEGDDGTVVPVQKKAKANPKLVSVEVEGVQNTSKADTEARSKRNSAKTPKPQRSPSPVERLTEPTPPVTAPQRPKLTELPSSSPEVESPEPEQPTKKSTSLDQTNAEIAALKASMKRNITAAPQPKESHKNALEAMIPATSTRGRKRGKATDEKGALDLFKAFKQRLEDLPPDSTSTNAEDGKDEGAAAQVNGHDSDRRPSSHVPNEDGEEEEEVDLCDLHFIAHCQSCRAWSKGNGDEGGKLRGRDGDADTGNEHESDDEDSNKWMSHTLTFAKDTLGKDLEWKKKMAEIEVIDPREKARELKEKRKSGRERDKGIVK